MKHHHRLSMHRLFPLILALVVLNPRQEVLAFLAATPQQTPKTQLQTIPRREVLSTGAIIGAALGSHALGANAATQSDDLLADLPMIRLKLPKQGFGREYVALQLKVNGEGPFDFMVDSGLTTEMITPHLQKVLNIQVGKNTVSGLAAGGERTSALADLDNVELCCGNFANDRGLKLPKLHAVITDFPQEHIDPSHDVEGMLGMELLTLFDVDFDFPNNRIRFWKPGTANKKGLDEIPAVVINETGLIGIRLTVPGAKQPILAFLDCGATFSCMNWKAAELFGLPPKNDTSYSKQPAVAALGIDGNMMTLPVVKQTLTFLGEVQQDPATGRPIGFAPPPTDWKPWNPVQTAIGDIPAFSTILGDGRTPFQGPAALIGLDVLAQRRVVLEAARDESRRRRVFVSPQNVSMNMLPMAGTATCCRNSLFERCYEYIMAKNTTELLNLEERALLLKKDMTFTKMPFFRSSFLILHSVTSKILCSSGTSSLKRILTTSITDSTDFPVMASRNRSSCTVKPAILLRLLITLVASSSLITSSKFSSPRYIIEMRF